MASWFWSRVLLFRANSHELQSFNQTLLTHFLYTKFSFLEKIGFPLVSGFLRGTVLLLVTVVSITCVEAIFRLMFVTPGLKPFSVLKFLLFCSFRSFEKWWRSSSPTWSWCSLSSWQKVQTKIKVTRTRKVCTTCEWQFNLVDNDFVILQYHTLSFMWWLKWSALQVELDGTVIDWVNILNLANQIGSCGKNFNCAICAQWWWKITFSVLFIVAFGWHSLEAMTSGYLPVTMLLHASVNHPSSKRNVSFIIFSGC